MKKIHLHLFCNFLIATASAQAFVNPSLETWGAPTVCETNQAPTGWADYSTGCAAVDEGNLSLCPSTIPPVAAHGNVYARACTGGWSGGEGLAQIISGFSTAQTYTLMFDYAGSNLYDGNDSIYWQVFLDDVYLSQSPLCGSKTPTWSTYSVTFTTSNGAHKLGFRCYAKTPPVSGDGSGGIDNFRLLPLPETTSISEIDLLAGIEVYPQLVNRYIAVKGEFYGAVQLRLYDLRGSVLKETTLSRPTTINVQDLEAGIYICYLQTKSGVSRKVRLVKE